MLGLYWDNGKENGNYYGFVDLVVVVVAVGFGVLEL